MIEKALHDGVVYISSLLWGWPLILTFLLVGIITTSALYAIQFRFFFRSWRLLLFPEKTAQVTGDQPLMTPAQAFLNALGTSTGNGSIAGVATAVQLGGPGAAFWIVVFGLFSMVIRFAEVYLATYGMGRIRFGNVSGGPIVYLSQMPGGKFLAYLFAFFMFMYALTSGNAMQVNSIGLGMHRTWDVAPWMTAVALALFVTYALLGGAQRVVTISDKLTPFKVSVFLIASLIVVAYHWQAIVPAISLIISSAFCTQSLCGGAVGFTVQQAMRNGFARSVNAHEAGLGTAGIFFGATESKRPMEDSLMSMVGVVVSNFAICFLVALIVIASGVWNNGQTSTALTISAFNTVFGQYGGWVVTFCAASFGLGVLVSMSFIARSMWLFLTGGRGVRLFEVVYILVAIGGTLARVDLIWHMNDIVNGVLLLMNLAAIVWYLGMMRRDVAAYIQKES